MKFKIANKITLLISDCCNLQCSHCNTCCNVSSVNKFLNQNDIDSFCAAIKPSGHIFEQIALSGGEPMLNPEIMGIIDILVKSDLAKTYTLLTNGTVKTNLLTKIAEKIEVVNSHKEKQPNHVFLQTVAPIDVNLFDSIKKCFILPQCGLGYSRQGFYPCVISAAIGRIFGVNGIQYWEDVNKINLTKLLWQTCKYCGYYLNGTNCDLLPEYKYPPIMMTDSWKKALEWYKKLPEEHK